MSNRLLDKDNLLMNFQSLIFHISCCGICIFTLAPFHTFAVKQWF